MSAEENKALARHSWGLLDNPDILEEVYAPDLVWHEPDQDVQGLEEAKRFLGMYKTAFPDLHATVEDHHPPHRRRQDSRGVGALRQSERDATAGARPRTVVAGRHG
jgi:hypothetical protein